jgi:voltage-gated potassium channel
LTALVGALSGLLTAGIALVVAATVVAQQEVNVQSIRGAICVYLLLGMFFVFLYGIVTSATSSPFFAQGTDGTRSLRVYFSFVTLATLGYGDYTPRTDLGHLLSVLEALMGQLYLVTVVAILVARIGPRDRIARRR